MDQMEPRHDFQPNRSDIDTAHLMRGSVWLAMQRAEAILWLRLKKSSAYRAALIAVLETLP